MQLSVLGIFQKLVNIDSCNYLSFPCKLRFSFWRPKNRFVASVTHIVMVLFIFCPILLKSTECSAFVLMGKVAHSLIMSEKFVVDDCRAGLSSLNPSFGNIEGSSEYSCGGIKFISPISTNGEEMASKKTDSCCCEAKCGMRYHSEEKIRHAVSYIYFSVLGIILMAIALNIYYKFFF